MNILQNLVERLNTILDKDFGAVYPDASCQEAFEDGVESVKLYIETALELIEYDNESSDNSRDVA